MIAKNVFLTLMLVAGALLAGCVTVPDPSVITEAEKAAVSYGPPPTDYTNQIKGYFEATLKDPYTAHYYFSDLPPSELILRASERNGGKLHGGWLVFADVNAKNGYGGYTGKAMYWFFFETNKLTFYKASGEHWQKWR